MSRRDELFLHDIHQACDKVLRFTSGLEREQFLSDEKTYDAVLRNLEIIGGAAKHVSEEARARFPAIEWRKIAAFRDIVAHEYFGLDNEILWDVIQTQIPILAEKLRQINLD